MTQTLGATIADEARFAGSWKGRDLTVLGAFEGGLELSGRLHLGPSAKFKGQVRASAVEIEGEFEGEVRAESLAFGPQARARGLFLAPRLAIRDGACVEGALNLEPGPAAAPNEARGKGAKSKGAPVEAPRAANDAPSAGAAPPAEASTAAVPA
jgi:cytoskeletal protein CcmA (bactofilin family)